MINMMSKVVILMEYPEACEKSHQILTKNLVDEVREGKYKRYKLRDDSIDSKYIEQLLKTHHPKSLE